MRSENSSRQGLDFTSLIIPQFDRGNYDGYCRMTGPSEFLVDKVSTSRIGLYSPTTQFELAKRLTLADAEIARTP